MGRRPGTNGRSKHATLNGVSPEVQAKIDELALFVLEECLARLKEKKGTDEKAGTNTFKQLSVKELLKEVRGMISACTKTATSLTQLNFPQLPQNNPEDRTRRSQIEGGAKDPQKLEDLRMSQDALLAETEDGKTAE